MAAEIPDGAVLIARAIFNSSLWTMRDEDRILAITLIGLCNWKDRRWYDGRDAITVKRGQTVRTERELAEAANLSRQNIRTSLKRLEKSGFLTRKPTQHYTLITLPKYDKYQTLSMYSDSVNPEANQHVNRIQPNPTQTQPNPNPYSKEPEEGKERKERKEGEEAAPPPPSSSPPKDFRADLGNVLDKVTGSMDAGRARPKAKVAVKREGTVGHLLKVAERTTKMPNRPDTLRHALDSVTARYGGAFVEKWLMDPESVGKNTIEMQDELRMLFTGQQPGEPPSFEQLRKNKDRIHDYQKGGKK